MTEEIKIAKSDEKIDEKSTKVAFLKQFKGLTVNEKEIEESKNKTTIETHEEELKPAQNKIIEIKNREEWVIRLKKRTLLLGLGVILGAMWLVLIGKWFGSNYGGKIHFGKGIIVIEQAVDQANITPVPIAAGPKIRIRDTIADATGAAELMNQLKQVGFENVEVVEDNTSEFSGVGVVVKVDGAELRLKLEEALKQNYAVTSPSAELTADSDFDAVVFYGSHARETTKNN